MFNGVSEAPTVANRMKKSRMNNPMVACRFRKMTLKKSLKDFHALFIIPLLQSDPGIQLAVQQIGDQVCDDDRYGDAQQESLV